MQPCSPKKGLPNGEPIVVCGLPGAGKTTRAKRIESELRAIRFWPGEWMLAREIDLWDEASHGERGGVPNETPYGRVPEPSAPLSSCAISTRLRMPERAPWYLLLHETQAGSAQGQPPGTHVRPLRARGLLD